MISLVVEVDAAFLDAAATAIADRGATVLYTARRAGIGWVHCRVPVLLVPALKLVGGCRVLS